MIKSIKDKVAIVGAGCSKFGERWDCGVSDLIIESTTEAFKDAGVGPEDIQAVYLGQLYASSNGIAAAAAFDSLKMKSIPYIRNENWCCSGHIALIEACLAVASGTFDIVMALGVEKLKDTGFPGLGTGRGMNPVYEARRTAPGSFGMIATRYFHDYGLTMDEGRTLLAKIAVKNHFNGSLSPKSHLKNKITIEQALNAMPIAYPLGLFDCCGNSDGSACLIIMNADLAKKYRDDPVYVKGFGVAADPVLPHTRPGFNWTEFKSLQASSQMAYDMAGITNPREELDVAEVHDCFTCTELAIYENFRFTTPGGAIKDINEGFFERTGGLPVNVDGGLKSFGHPVGASGLRMSYEIYKQLQGRVDNPERQLKDVHRGLSHTFGGPPQLSAVAIFGNEKG